MKKLLFVKDLDKEEVRKRISEALDQTRAIYNISTSNKCIAVEGNNDIVRVATIAIKELGYIIE
jgi:hypothetical protein